MLRNASRVAACGLFPIAVLAAAGASAAPDARAVADALVAAFNASGKVVASYDNAAAGGDAVTITGFKVVQPKRSGRDLTIATIVVAGAAERQPGGITAASMTFSDGSASYRGIAATWQTAVVNDAVIPAAEEMRSLDSPLLPFSTASVSGIAVGGPAPAEPAAIARIDLAVTADADGKPDGVTFATTDFNLPVAALSEPEVVGTLHDLGFTSLALSVAGDAGFDIVADTLVLRSLVIEAADVGKLTIGGAFSQVRVHDIVGIGGDGKPAARRAPNLDTLSVRFDNGGAVERALDTQAELVGQTREDTAAQWPTLFAFLIGGSKPFQESLKAALTTFFQSPKSFTVTLAPAAPVAVDKVLHLLSGDRTQLPDLLAAGITVND